MLLISGLSIALHNYRKTLFAHVLQLLHKSLCANINQSIEILTLLFQRINSRTNISVKSLTVMTFNTEEMQPWTKDVVQKTTGNA